MRKASRIFEMLAADPSKGYGVLSDAFHYASGLAIAEYLNQKNQLAQK